MRLRYSCKRRNLQMLAILRMIVAQASGELSHHSPVPPGSKKALLRTVAHVRHCNARRASGIAYAEGVG